MEKIEVLPAPPAIPDEGLEGYSPEPGAVRIRIVAYSLRPGHVGNLHVWRSFGDGVWLKGDALRVETGAVAAVDCLVDDVREEFVVVSDGGPSSVAGLTVLAESLRPPISRRDVPSGARGGDYGFEILEDVRRHLPRPLREVPLPEAVRILEAEWPDLVELRRGVCALFRISGEGVPASDLLDRLADHVVRVAQVAAGPDTAKEVSAIGPTAASVADRTPPPPRGRRASVAPAAEGVSAAPAEAPTPHATET